MISIIDYGCGNLHSLKYALSSIGLASTVSRNEADILSSAGAILPGVGAFGSAMENIRSSHLDQTIKRYVESGKMLLGVCLGMHLLASTSNEFGEHQGLGLIPGRVVKLKTGAMSKVPNVGWCSTQLMGNPKNAQDKCGYFYYTHSYEFQPSNQTFIRGTTKHAEREIVAVLRNKNVIGTQFHPEKSGHLGLEFLKDCFCD